MEKILSLKKLLKELKKRKGRKIVFTNGCFDILHAGHVRYLKKAKSLGDMLVLGLNSDSSVRNIKGKGRPIVNQKDRAEVVSSLSPVDYVVIFNEPTPIKLIEAIKPDILVKGADWKRGSIIGEDFVRGCGGRISRIRLFEGRSTTGIIKRILALKR